MSPKRAAEQNALKTAIGLLFCTAMSFLPISAQELGRDSRAPLPPVPSPQNLPQPGPTNDAPYAPQPILQGGIVIQLYPPGSPFLNAERVRQAEQYNLSKAVPGRISSIVNIHNPSIEVHPVEGGINTGAAVILAAGAGTIR